MSKIIKLTPEHLQEIYKDFSLQLQTAKLTDGKISYTKSIGAVDRKAKLFFTELAWEKMQVLIREYNKEVAWHGLAKRSEDKEKDEYTVYDILVYPQEVTSSTVNTDQEKYQTWLYQQEDDVFNNIRFQGHSHVNMSTNPSGVDLTHQAEILSQLDDDMFYIFVIWNKSGSKNIKIYDLAKNVLFETADVTVEILKEENGVLKFLDEAKEMVKDRVYKSQHYSGWYDDTDYPYGGYSSGYGYGSSKHQPTVTTPTTATTPATTPVNKQEKKTQKTQKKSETKITPIKSGKKNKGRRKDRRVRPTQQELNAGF